MRQTIARGSSGSDVALVQQCLDVSVDADFGKETEVAVKLFQDEQKLDVDGVVGPATWTALEQQYHLPPYPPPLLAPLPRTILDMVTQLALQSTIARYQWRDRGEAPNGYIMGMAIGFTTLLRKWQLGSVTVDEIARADSGDTSVDALAWYADVFDEFGMRNTANGVETLRHLFVLQLGLGMRESSGMYCVGRDMSAENVSADTCEAGLFQMSWNARNCAPELMQRLFDEYAQSKDPAICARSIFADDVICSDSNWASYGSGPGYDYQVLAKKCPQFAIETAAVGLRNLRQHWGPINRKEAEVRPEADDLFIGIQRLLDNIPVA